MRSAEGSGFKQILTVLHRFCNLLLSDDFDGRNLHDGAFSRCGFLSAFAWGETGK